MVIQQSARRGSLAALSIFFAVVGASSTAQAYEIYFNGVRVTGLTNRSFEQCEVRFDAKGNVYIKAKGYTVKTADKPNPPPAPSKPTPLSKRYFLVSTGKLRKQAQYKVDVYINGRFIKTVRSSQAQLVMPINRHLRPGKNQIHFAASKDLGGKSRVSQAASHFLHVLVGEGKTSGGTIRITHTLADIRAPASRTDNFARASIITVQ